jgi:hypothetical protein
MPAKPRVEKHRGVTLVVRDDWATVVWDATGHSVEGPTESETEVRRFVSIAIDALRRLAEE